MPETVTAVAPAATTPPAAEPSPRVTIDEFCRRAARTDRRVELLAAFKHTEVAAGRRRDTRDAYAARYAAFPSTPA